MHRSGKFHPVIYHWDTQQRHPNYQIFVFPGVYRHYEDMENMVQVLELGPMGREGQYGSAFALPCGEFARLDRLLTPDRVEKWLRETELHKYGIIPPENQDKQHGQSTGNSLNIVHITSYTAVMSVWNTILKHYVIDKIFLTFNVDKTHLES